MYLLIEECSLKSVLVVYTDAPVKLVKRKNYFVCSTSTDVIFTASFFSIFIFHYSTHVDAVEQFPIFFFIQTILPFL